MRLNSYLINMHTKGGIDKKSLNYLLEGNGLKYGPGYIHILPNFHRLDQLVLQNIFNCGINIDKIIPPGRPMISQIGSVTECIGHYIDHFLVSIVQNQCTYIKDTTYFINKIESWRPHANCWLVSFDISNMFTNMPIIHTENRRCNLSSAKSRMLWHVDVSNHQRHFIKIWKIP